MTIKKKRACRMVGEVRKRLILESAVKLALDIGYYNLTRVNVSKLAKVSRPLVSKYFFTIDNLRKTVFKHALKFNILEIIAQGIMSKDPLTKKIDEQTRQDAIKHLINK